MAGALEPGGPGRRLNTRELLTIAGSADRRPAGPRSTSTSEAAEKSRHRPPVPSPSTATAFWRRRSSGAIAGDEDTIADAASPELADIRRHMRAAESQEPPDLLQKIISSSSYGKFCRRASSPSGTAALWCR
ncbi:MAG: hypothetical protein ACLR1T_09940 [Evtepia gabavorous]